MSTVIFDFDGTLADSFRVFIDIAYEVSGRTEPLPKPEIARLRGMRPLDIMKDLDIKTWQIPFLAFRGRRQMRKQMDRVQVFAGMPELVAKLAKNGHQLYIMSSNSVRNIEPFLQRYNMNTEFIKIYGNVGIFAKARLLKRVLRQNKLAANSAYYICDEVRDVVAAQAARVCSIAVSWGYNDTTILEAHQPDFLAHKPSDILKFVK